MSKTSAIESECDFWFCFKEQDGGWSPWYQCSLKQYMQFKEQRDAQVWVTKKGEKP